MKKTKGGYEIRISYRPWPAFFLFVLVNAVLSYSPLSIVSKLFIGLFGLALPFFLALYATGTSPRSSVPLYEKESLSQPALWVFGLAALGAFILRFYPLTEWAVWPNTDEGLNGWFALDLARQWNWRFLYTFGQVPPLLIWVLSLIVPRAENPLMGLWLVPAGFSFLAVLLSYQAVRPYFSKSLSFIFFLFWALSFWPLYYGRFCHEGVLLPLWACLVLWRLGSFLKAKDSGAKTIAAITLGLATGLGSFTFTPWPVFALWVFILAFSDGFFRRDKAWRPFLWFGASFFLANLPFLFAIFQEGFGNHIWGVSAARGYVPMAGQITAWFSYLTTPFWGCFEEAPAYTALWGGMLNPLLTGAFFIGVLESYLNRSRWKVRWAWVGAFLSMAPGFLTLNVELYRVILILPFLLAGAALGVHRLLTESPSSRRGLVLSAFVLVSLVLDITHLHSPLSYPVDSAQGVLLGAHPAKLVNTYLAYQLLLKQSSQGPGLFFSDFTSIPYDQTLTVGAYGFNALLNPKIPMEKAKWVAFLVNINEKPFLEKRFPNGQWYWLDKDCGLPDGGWMLGVIPVAPENHGAFDQWVRVYPFFRDMDWHWLNLADGVKGESYLADFARVKPLLAGDPLLEGFYWEKVEGLLYRDRNYPEDVASLEKAIAEGYPSAHFYYKLGSIQLRKNEFERARQSLRQAQGAPLNLTLSKEASQMADEIEKQGGVPQP